MWELTVYQKKTLENVGVEVEESVKFTSDDLEKLLSLVDELSRLTEVGKTRFSLMRPSVANWRPQTIIPREKK